MGTLFHFFLSPCIITNPKKSKVALDVRLNLRCLSRSLDFFGAEALPVRKECQLKKLNCQIKS